MLRSYRLISTLALGAASFASAAEPYIDQLTPQGVRRGDAAAVVKITGPRVGEEPLEVLFDEPGVSVSALKAIDGGTVEATLAIAPDSELGRKPLRLRTATGLSNLVTLHVGALEHLDEAEPNNTVAEAQAAPLDRTVRGIVLPEDEDLFAVDLVGGERFSAEVEGIRLGRTFFDPVIEVLDESGESVAKNDDRPAAYQDAFLSFIPTTSGKHLVRVREAAMGGDGRSNYLLHLGKFPRPTAVFPPAAAAGADIAVRWIGDAAGNHETKLTTPATPGETHLAFATDDHGVAPSPLPIRLYETPPTAEAEPNNSRDKANVLTWPASGPLVAVGVIESVGDVDHFRFTAKAQQNIDLRVRARELRSGLDPVLRVFDAAGARLAGNDDDQGAPDSYLRFVAPAAGDFTLQVEDRLHRGGPDHVYALEAASPQAIADITIDERRWLEATTLEVPQGGRTAFLARVTRRDFGGEVALALDNLPPGVRAECAPLAADFNLVPVVLRCDPETPLAASLATPKVAATDTANPVSLVSRFRQQTWLVRGRNNVSVWSHFAQRAPVAVTKALPFTVAVAQPPAPLCRDGALPIEVELQRAEGFTQPVSVYTLYDPPGVSSNRSIQVPEGQTKASIPLTANSQAWTRGWPIAVVAEANINGRVYGSSAFVTLQVAEAYFDVAVPTVTTRAAEPVDLVVTLAHRTPFDGKATLEVVGLPAGVTAEPVEVVTVATDAKFRLMLGPEAKVGRHGGIGVRVRLVANGGTVEYRHGYAELRIDPAPAKEAPQQTAQQVATQGENAS